MNPLKKKEYIARVATSVFYYNRKNNTSLAQFAQKLNLHANGKISKEDLEIFFRGIQAPLSLFETDAILEAIDPEKTGTIKVDDFIELVKPYVGSRPVINK